MLEILQNKKISDGMIMVGFVLLVLGVATNFQNQKKDETKIEIKETDSAIETEVTIRPTYTEPMVNKRDEVKININKDGTEKLEKLSGIGPKMAARIMEYREQNGGFRDKEEIKLVKGIGEKMYEKIKDEIEI